MNKQLNISRLLILFVIAVGLFAFLRTFVIDIIQVQTNSMYPAVTVGKKCLIEKMSFRFRKPQKNDIVYFPSPVQKHMRLLKRIIATEGDIVEIRDKEVYINDKRLNENYVYHSRPSERLVGDNFGPLTVPTGMVFLLGDNRDESEDSRDWIDPVTQEHIHFVPVNEIKGRLFR